LTWCIAIDFSRIFLGFLSGFFSNSGSFAVPYSTAMGQCPDDMPAQGERPLSRSGECRNTETAQFPGTGPQKHPVKRGQRFREIKPVRFKLLVYFGRPTLPARCPESLLRSERRLQLFVLTRFLNANRGPPRYPSPGLAFAENA
jgi:hypothetical protein